MARRGEAWQGMARRGKAGHGKRKEIFMNNVKPFPGWKNALKHITARVENEGYGVFISHKELLSWLDIGPKPANVTTYEKWVFEKLQQIETLKDELLTDHNIKLQVVKGEGYNVLHPNDQVTKGVDLHFRKAKKQINKAIQTLANVNQELLSMETEHLRLRNMVKMGFVKSAMNKRKFELPQEPEKKKIA